MGRMDLCALLQYACYEFPTVACDISVGDRPATNGLVTADKTSSSGSWFVSGMGVERVSPWVIADKRRIEYP